MESGKIIVVANQKGGVAKTSTVRNLSYALAEMGKKVLVVDFDPQYNLTTSFGVLPTQAPYNTGTLITNLLLDESLPDTNEFIQKIGSVDLIPSSRSLTVAEANLLMTPDSNDYLAALLNPLRLSYDYIIVDTNPSLGSLTINALTAADEVIIPIDPELFALTGLQALVDTIKKIKRKLNPSIEIGGILFTKCNKRTNLYGSLISAISKSIVQQRGAADSAKDPLTRQRAEKAAEDGEKIMQRIDQEGETVAMMSLTVMPIAQDEVNFTKVCRRVESAFNIQKCKVRTLANLQKEGFQSIWEVNPMLLYLTSNQKSNLIDPAVRNMTLPAKKLVGRFSLKSFVTKDMRNYANAKFFVVDAACIEESGNDFTLALQSFQMMFSARIIVILSGYEDVNDEVQRLLSIGVVNLVTGETMEDALDELTEALSEDGMQRYVVKAPVYEQPATQREKAPEPDEIIPYRWNARNIRIAVAGSQRRSGVTVTAFNLASWLAARGAEVAYIEVNQNRHLQLLLNIYEAAPDGEHYTIDGIDCYLTNEPDKAYQFIIYDCGVMQTPTSIFRDADHRLLCGSVLPYEIPVFHKALSECGSLEVRPVAICVPQEIQEYCMELFGENVQIAAASHDLFAKRVNGQIYRPLVEKYIAGEKRL